jgi:hypothetical protein
MEVISTVTIKLGEQIIRLTQEEAQLLHDELDKILPKKTPESNFEKTVKDLGDILTKTKRVESPNPFPSPYVEPIWRVRPWPESKPYIYMGPLPKVYLTTEVGNAKETL